MSESKLSRAITLIEEAREHLSDDAREIVVESKLEQAHVLLCQIEEGG